MSRRVTGIFLALALLSAGCRSSPHVATVMPGAEGEIAMLSLTSTAFKESETISKKYTCDDADTSPDLQWSNPPSGTTSLALIVDDPDAPGRTWVHWVLYNIPTDRMGLPEGVSKTPTVQGIGVQGKNDFGKTGYNGPCPPKGKPHRYFFKLYALDSSLNLKPGATKADVEKAMRGHILAQGQLVGQYGR